MNLQVEMKRRPSATAEPPASVLERLAVIVLAAPTAEPPFQGASTGDCPNVLPDGGPTDDLANATWEDAEWQ